MSERSFVKLILAMLLTTISVSGCGGVRSNMGTVTGRVTSGDEPLSAIEVRFNPEGTGRSSVGYTNTNGEYELQYSASQPGALIGQHDVMVLDRTGKVSIPAEHSKHKFKVEPGVNRFDIKIPANQ